MVHVYFHGLATETSMTSIGSFYYLQSTSDQVYVDVNKLLDGYKRTKIVRAQFEEKAKTLNANVDSIR